MKEAVYAYLKTIPAGKVVTYGQLAAAVKCSKTNGSYILSKRDTCHLMA